MPKKNNFDMNRFTTTRNDVSNVKQSAAAKKALENIRKMGGGKKKK